MMDITRFPRCHNSGKIVFPKRKTARKVITELSDPYMMEVYRCPACKGWHVGHGKGSNQRWRDQMEAIVRGVVRSQAYQKALELCRQ